jgi:hypothetical protein
LPVGNNLNDELNQQLISVEDWLMESAVTDIEKDTSLIIPSQTTDDGTDDLYKDLIFPTLINDEPRSQSDETIRDENHRREELVEKILPDNHKQIPQRSDKHQRRFALMRQLAEKSNKTVTKKII